MSNMQFSLAGLEPSQYGFAVLVLNRTPLTHTLRVRLGALDAQPLASELAGVPTVRSRMGVVLGQMVERLDGHLAHVFLQCTEGNMIEASVVVETALEQISVPMTCGDAFALAVAHRLPIFGDLSLGSLLKPIAHEHADEVVLPSGIDAFLSSL